MLGGQRSGEEVLEFVTAGSTRVKDTSGYLTYQQKKEHFNDHFASVLLFFFPVPCAGFFSVKKTKKQFEPLIIFLSMK